MDIFTLDFETFYGDEYTLSKMTTESYIRDPRFEILGCGVRMPDGSRGWLDKQQFAAWVPTIAWQNFAVLAHHAQFDGLILSHHYGVKPGYWLDTLSMARLILGNHLSVALASLSEHFHLAAKSVPYNLFKNRRWHELDPATQQLVADGCLHDVDLTFDIFNRLAPSFPVEEYPIVDTTIRMFTEPLLRGDTQIFGQVWMTEETRKVQAKSALNVTSEALQSNEQFAQLLKAAGAIEHTLPEIIDNKWAPDSFNYIKRGKDDKEGIERFIYAFAKTDQFMIDLQESQVQQHSDLALARLGEKSTIDQTRAERLGNMAMRGPMCVYLNMYGAHTTRWSGGDSLNWQNLRRGGLLRKGVVAPPGYMLGIVDEAQIECRVLNKLAGQEWMLDKFRNHEDPYADIASKFYGEQVYKPKADDPRQVEMEAKRGTGKQLTLSCGFQAGAQTIVNTAKLGIYGPPVYLTLAEGLAARDLYRRENPGVVQLWKTWGKLISRVASKDYPPLEMEPMTIHGGRIYGPGGTWLNYTTLEYDKEWESWKVKTRKGWSRLYSGKIVENIVQWLARIVVSQAINRVRPFCLQHGIKICMTSHDEFVFALPITPNMLEQFEYIKAEFRREPSWLPGIPLEVEGILSERYEK